MRRTLLLLARKLGEICAMLLFITLAGFAVVALAPGDAALSVLRTDTVALSREDTAAYRAELGLDDPIPVRYVRYLDDLLHGDLGNSIMTGKPVAAELAAALPATLWLACAAILTTFVLVLILGTLASRYRGSLLDRTILGGCYLSASMPTFWFGLLLIQWFAVDLRVLPSSGWHRGAGLILPTVALAAAIAPPFIKLFRDAYSEVAGREFVRSARARGVSGSIIMYKHVLRGSLIPVVTVMGVSLGSLLSGSVVVEAVFGLPGMGKLAVEAVTRRDYGIIQGFVLAMGLAVLTINTLVDLSYRVISPEVRLKGGGRS